MEFKINSQQFRIKKRENIIATVFISLILLMAVAADIVGPKPDIRRIAVSMILIIVLGLFLKSIRKDYHKTKQNMLNHKLLIENNRLILENDGVKTEIDLKKFIRLISSIRKTCCIALLST